MIQELHDPRIVDWDIKNGHKQHLYIFISKENGELIEIALQ